MEIRLKRTETVIPRKTRLPANKLHGTLVSDSNSRRRNFWSGMLIMWGTADKSSRICFYLGAVCGSKFDQVNSCIWMLLAPDCSKWVATGRKGSELLIVTFRPGHSHDHPPSPSESSSSLPSKSAPCHYVQADNSASQRSDLITFLHIARNAVPNHQLHIPTSSTTFIMVLPFRA